MSGSDVSALPELAVFHSERKQIDEPPKTVFVQYKIGFAVKLSRGRGDMRQVVPDRALGGDRFPPATVSVDTGKSRVDYDYPGRDEKRIEAEHGGASRAEDGRGRSVAHDGGGRVGLCQQ
jgi:hypothetical protein